MTDTPSLPGRDRAAILFGLVGVTVLSWLWLIDMAVDMESMSAAGASMATSMPGAEPASMPASMPTSMPGAAVASSLQIRAWTAFDFAYMFAMWAVMMVGMMVPTAAPMTFVYAAVARKAARQGTPLAPTAAFVSGYIAMWTLFSVGATLAQWGLDQASLLSPMMVSTSPALGAGLLIVAGLYQLTPFKNACLEHCRSPARFFAQHWKKGPGGAFRLGIVHGAYCLGCCWVLMGLLFFGGVMNLLWIAAITFFVLLEKVLPFGNQGGRIAGVAMILSGVVFIAVAG